MPIQLRRPSTRRMVLIVALALLIVLKVNLYSSQAVVHWGQVSETAIGYDDEFTQPHTLVNVILQNGDTLQMEVPRKGQVLVGDRVEIVEHPRWLRKPLLTFRVHLDEA
ncbi:translation initiation factor 1 [Vibrio vulnificus]|nr:translation initiation factor 1 [Vibrio vulnificus]EGQ7936752.1 translation initiation factor 1 [Vibrio vulnificus]EGQ9972038.1 translation initiation factor 1 [Vibrio vulnificus]EHZ7122912.1 translation initiation factor 1 [Vibrio vulnificus]EHZ7124350.1 translation initiation factor 1 [Vibrio vulnificus]